MRNILACLRFYSAIFVLVKNPSIFLQPYSQAYSKHYAQYLSRFKVI